MMSQRDVSEVHRSGDTKPSANASAAVGEPKIATSSGDRETPAIVVTSREQQRTVRTHKAAKNVY